MYVEVGGDEIRRYRDLLYTRWRDGAFVAYVDVVDGVAAFAGDVVKKMRGEGVVEFFTRYCHYKEREQQIALDAWEIVKEIDWEKGHRYNRYFDHCNNESRWAYSLDYTQEYGGHGICHDTGSPLSRLACTY
jgi:hypothetical protein